MNPTKFAIGDKIKSPRGENGVVKEIRYTEDGGYYNIAYPFNRTATNSTLSFIEVDASWVKRDMTVVEAVKDLSTKELQGIVTRMALAIFEPADSGDRVVLHHIPYVYPGDEVDWDDDGEEDTVVPWNRWPELHPIGLRIGAEPKEAT